MTQTKQAAAPKVGFVSLGCPKALVDSEHILTRLRAEGYEISPSYEGSDLVVINTCGFIDAAVEESLDAIGEALNENGKVIVTGCLGAKADVVMAAHPRCLPSPAPMPPSRSCTRCTSTCPSRTIPSPTCAAAGRQADAQSLRLPEDFRRLQSPLHLLHHPVDARRSRQPADRRCDARSREPRQCRREGAAGRLARHQRVRRRRQVPHRFLGGRPVRTKLYDLCTRARRTGRLGAPALRLPVPQRRRHHPADGRRQDPALPRRALPARQPAHPQG
jgi:hypothetical protein